MRNAIEIMEYQGSDAYDTVLEPLLEQIPAKLSKLLNCAPDEVTYVESTSMGLNMLAQSMPLQAGQNVLLCDLEFPANVYPWLNLTSKGIQTRFVSNKNGGLSIDELDKMRDENSRVVALSAIQFFSGRLEQIKDIGSYCREQGLWLVVDAMQAVGVSLIDMDTMGIHALVAGGQKAVLGTSGQGFMVIRRTLLEQLSPIFVGAVSVEGWDAWLNYDMKPRSGASRFRMGTSNIVGLAALDAGLDLLLHLDPASIYEWVQTLSAAAMDDLSARGYSIVTPQERGHFANIVTFAVDSDPGGLAAKLREAGVILRSHMDRDGNPFLRISTHAYNTVDDVLRVGHVLGDKQ
jgi:selenocysteine lyase/cysteine desulfurase